VSSKNKEVPNLKRIFWSLGVGFCGFFVGGMMGAGLGSIFGFVWGASIGYGFGMIFDQQYATNKIIAYWGITFALAGIFFGIIYGAQPEESTVHMAKMGGIGATAGMLLGLLVGSIHIKQLRRKS
jgi:hypothetical protein